MHATTRTVVSVVLLILTCFDATVSRASGPSSKDPELLFSPWTDESVSKYPVEYYTAAAKLYETIIEELEGYEKTAKAGKVKSLNLVKVGTTHAYILDLQLYAERLVGWGETAGHDLAMRTGKLEQRLGAIATPLRLASADTIAKGLPVLQNKCKQQQKLIKATQELIDQGKLEAAESKFQPEYRKLVAMAYWYEYQQRLAPMGPYDKLRADLSDAIRKANLQEAKTVIAALCDKTRPDLTKLPAAVSQAAAGLSSAAEVEFQDKSVSGPKLFMAAAKEWYSLHRATLRTLALHWAMTDSTEAASAVDDVAKAYPEFEKDMLKALASIIEADTSRATEDDAAQLYAAYVKGIADITSVSRDQELIKAFDSALEALAAKSPALSANLLAYQGATEDWLRWRARAAESASRSKRPKSPEATIPLTQPRLQVLDGSAQERLAEIVEKILDKQTNVTSEFLAVAKAARPTSGYLDWMYCRAAIASVPTDPTLQTDLLVTEDMPALTIKAARALAGLKRGTLLEVGGKVSGVELTGMTPFYAVDTDDRKAVLTMGALPAIATIGYEHAFKYIHIIADLEPEWVRGEYYFAELK